MVLTKEYRICMPMTVDEYKVGQLYMIARHSLEQSGDGEGVEVVQNVPCDDPIHGKGHYTEKKIHLSSRLPYWVQSVIPKIFYITEKAWNYYPYTVTEYHCSFMPKFRVCIKTRYQNDSGTADNCMSLTPEQLAVRLVEHLDIAYDEVQPKHYKEEEDPRFFHSDKTTRGPLVEGWKNNSQPIMCSYKLVDASFEVWGFQTKVEDFIHSCIREVLLLGHRQAFVWIDSWIEMTYDDVKAYENKMQQETNVMLKPKPGQRQASVAESLSAKTPEDGAAAIAQSPSDNKSLTSGTSPPNATTPEPKKGYFSGWFS